MIYLVMRHWRAQRIPVKGAFKSFAFQGASLPQSPACQRLAVKPRMGAAAQQQWRPVKDGEKA